MRERGDGHIINVSTWGVLSESMPRFGPYNASKSALTAISRVIEAEWADDGVHSTTVFYPLVLTPMIAPTREYDGLPGLTAERSRRLDDHRGPHAAAAHRAANGGHRPRLEHRRARAVDAIMKRQRVQPNG